MLDMIDEAGVSLSTVTREEFLQLCNDKEFKQEWATDLDIHAVQ